MLVLSSYIVGAAVLGYIIVVLYLVILLPFINGTDDDL